MSLNSRSQVKLGSETIRKSGKGDLNDKEKFSSECYACDVTWN